MAGLACLAGLSPLRELERSLGLQALYALRGMRPEPPGVVVVSLNSKAADALGIPARPDRWPRALHAELVERLHAQGAKVVAFDLLFDQPREADGDERFAQALRTAGNVVLVAYLRREIQQAGNTLVTIDKLVPPMPALREAALAVAPFALVKSTEGILEYFAFAPEGDDVPSLPLVMAAQYQARLSAWRQLLSGPAAHIRLNLYGPPGRVRTVPYDFALQALREGNASAKVFDGAAVLVGSSEFNQPEQRDSYRTPWSTEDGLDVSGVELAATALANQLDGSALRRWPLAKELALLAMMGVALMTPWRLLPVRQALLWSVGIAGVYAAVASGMFSHANWWLPWVLPLLIVWPLSVVLGLGLRLRDVERQRQRLRMALDRYGPRDEIARLARELRRHDDTVHVVCLSTDIEDYTRRIEGREPGEARHWLNAYFEVVFPIVRRHGGHVVDHAGDAMVCIWLCGKDPEAACLSAVAAVRALHAALNAGLPVGVYDSDACPTRLGLHFGPVSLGEVGDAQHAEQRVVGDIVNTASRIQSANKRLGTRVLISDLIARHLPPQSCRRLGQFLLTGKSQPVGLCDPLPADLEQLALWQGALDAWAQGRWEAALGSLNRLLERWPQDGPARLLREHWHGHEGQQGPIPLHLK